MGRNDKVKKERHRSSKRSRYSRSRSISPSRSRSRSLSPYRDRSRDRRRSGTSGGGSTRRRRSRSDERDSGRSSRRSSKHGKRSSRREASKSRSRSRDRSHRRSDGRSKRENDKLAIDDDRVQSSKTQTKLSEPVRDALTDEIGASPPLPEKTEVTETVTAASPTLAKDVDEEKDEKKSNGKSTPSPGSDVDMEIVEDSRSATASTPTTNSKQPASKPVGGFFGVDDDDDGAAIEMAKRKKKKMITLSDDEDDGAAVQIPGTLSGGEEVKSAKAGEAEDEEEDALELFMTNIKQEVSEDALQKENGKDDVGKEAEGRMLSDEEDAGGVRRAASDEEEDFVEEEEEEEESWLTKVRKKRLIYEKIDHNKMKYGEFKKNFYIESPELAKMTPEEVQAYRRELGGIRIRGKNCPRPVKSWGQCGLPSAALETIRKLGYEKPTPIQAQAIPCIMSGRDVIGVAKTGSGKTLAFVLPLMRHIAAQPPVTPGDGPIGVIIAPTRELAMQIHGEAKKFCKALNIRCVCAYGGSGVGEQISDLKRGAEVVVCTPGRMIDLLAMNHGRIANLKRATFVVLDEADRMFDMGFEPQITRIVENVRPDRQTVMFSATFPTQVEILARKILKTPVEIIIGGNSVAASTIDQHVEVIDEDKKFLRLLKMISAWEDKGAMLIFVERQETADRIFRDISRAGYRCLALHGGMDQADRDSAIVDFKNGDIDILVATSVAARGLDVKRLRVVINYDVPNHYEDYVHRVGRTGRAGNKGTAYTFITKEQDMYAMELVKALELQAKMAVEAANPGKKKEDLNLTEILKEAVPEDLRQLADEFSKKKKLGLVKHGAGSGYGGKGFKFTEDEDNANAEMRKMQAQEYGVEVKSTAKEEEADSKPVIKSIERDSHHADKPPRIENVPSPAPAAPVRPPVVPHPIMPHMVVPNGVPYSRMEERLSSRNGEEVRAQIEQKKLDIDLKAQKEGLTDEAAKKALMAREIASVLSNLQTAQRKPPPNVLAQQQQHLQQQMQQQLQQQLQQQQLQANKLIQSTTASAEKSAAAAAAAAINMRLGGRVPNEPQEPPPPEPEPETMRKYTELEINDYPQHARWKVTHKNALADIEDVTNCAVTTKGLFYPQGRNPAAGERKLFLLIEGPDERSVSNAHAEIKRRLDEAAMSRPDDKPQYGKYSVV